MTFNAGFKQLKKIANNEYCTLVYKKTYLDNKTDRVEITAYIDKYRYTKKHTTFFEALEEMQKIVTGPPPASDNHKIKDKE